MATSLLALMPTRLIYREVEMSKMEGDVCGWWMELWYYRGTVPL